MNKKKAKEMSEEDRVWNEHFDAMDSHLNAAESVFVLLKKRIAKSTARELLKYCREKNLVVVAPLNPVDDRDLTPPTVVFEVGDMEDNEDHVDGYSKDFPVDFSTRSTSYLKPHMKETGNIPLAAKIAKKIASWRWSGWSQGLPSDVVQRLRALAQSDREVRLFFTFISAVDYMRKADVLWNNGVKLFESHPELFDPDQASEISLERLESLLRDSGIYRYGRDVKAWLTIAKSLRSGTNSPICGLIDRGVGNAEDLRNDLQSLDNKDDARFPLLRGPKIEPMWLQIMADPGQGGARIEGMKDVPVAVDRHVRRVTENLGITDTRKSSLGKARPIIQSAWRKAVQTVDIGGPPGIAGTCAALDSALYFFGKDGCSKCEKENRRKPLYRPVCKHCVRFPPARPWNFWK